jgi:HEAT repeat protein
MTAPLPPAIKAVIAIERALERLSPDERAEALAILFPTNDPPHVARLQMALEACRAVVAPRARRSPEWPAWLVYDIVNEALLP